ncbi:4Fe-4S single cluster domain-containing protein [Actinoplanes siamensis]|uniref:Radical SAM protein n=1 Tax=Actinoplanes siamensis TaxID=1223317 RepID=A0A919N3M7_9ACTN|nr:4Fe-4S single cluster domain-containing protein [Actinoplanes siamensis]GIF03785.1 radical SAM protein [Actinoplanes siamensis]
MSEPPEVRLARFLDRTRAEGPGERTAIWVQGCSIRCPGCFNPHLFTARGGVPTRPAELVERILATGTGGVTLLGGEPFDQAEGLAAVAAGVRSAGRSVMTFTGFEYDDLRRRDDHGVAALLAETDLLVAGPFRRELLDHDRPWVGSTNQRFLHLTGRLREDAGPDRLEVTVSAAGEIAVNGWADTDTLDALLADIPRRRIKP